MIDGVRLRAEAEWLSARGAIGVHVSAPERVRTVRLLRRDGAAGVPPHPTESEAETLSADLRLQTSDDRAEACRATRLLTARAHLLAATAQQSPQPAAAQ